MRSRYVLWPAALLCCLPSGAATASPAAGRVPERAGGAPTARVTTEAQLRRAWADPARTRVDLGADVVLRDCRHGEPLRESPYPILLHGHGHTLRQACSEQRLLRQDGTGHVDLRHVRLTRGGADGPGAAVTTRGELTLRDGTVNQNLSEEPGGGLFSMRRITVHRSLVTGNLANDDGGGIYARRGGVRVYDSVLSNNLVDGSGGAIGSTGDILVVRSRIDGNTTDGDGGALYADEDGDVTVVGSSIDGSNADGPGGAIFTVDGDVAVLDSSLIGNRADDRGGAISGEADVLVLNSTVARNLAVAHAGGGIWARGDLALVNATITDNYAEGEGGGVLAAGTTTVLSSTLSGNIASVAANLGSAGTLRAQASIIGPARTEGATGDARPTRRSCRVYTSASAGHNFLTDSTCGLAAATDVRGDDPKLRPLEDDPGSFVLTPFDASPVRSRIPRPACVPALPRPLPAGQLLGAFVDWPELLARDAVGARRDLGPACDVGAVQSPPPPAEPPASPPPIPVGPPAVAVTRGAGGPPRAGSVVRAGRSLPRAARGTTRLEHVAARVAALDEASRRFDELLACTSEVPVDRVGDPAHRWGFRYDERDGTGIDLRPALVPHRGRDRPELRFLRLSRSTRCLSAAPRPDGTGRAARRAPARVAPGARRDLALLGRRVERIERRAERFDAWESCLSALPVTEAGDRDQDLGFVRPSLGRGGAGHDAGVDLDTGDDPDYELLAFVGSDRPFESRTCDTEPGEGFDGLARSARSVPGRGPATPGLRSSAARAGLAELEDAVEDLEEPVAEITRFDECLYTVGLRAADGYDFRSPSGRRSRRPVLSFDLGPTLPQLDLMAFPGEEPPQIECDEDAGDADDDE